MVWIGASKCDIALDIFADVVLLDDCIAVFDEKDAFFKILVDLVAVDGWKGLMFYFYPCLFVETNHVVIYDLTAIILAFN